MKGKHSEWLTLKSKAFFEDHYYEVEPFINCYRTFSGVAGKCANCYAELLCKEITENFMKFARKEIELKKKGFTPECLARDLVREARLDRADLESRKLT